MNPPAFLSNAAAVTLSHFTWQSGFPAIGFAWQTWRSRGDYAETEAIRLSTSIISATCLQMGRSAVDHQAKDDNAVCKFCR